MTLTLKTLVRLVPPCFCCFLQLQKAAEGRLKYRLQIPPFMKGREPITAVLSSDPKLEGLESSTLVFTDITFGVKDRVRTKREPGDP